VIAVPGQTYLYRRGAAYWFRRRVPPGLQEALGRQDWRESLRTNNLAEAKAKLNLRAVATDREIAAATFRLSGTCSPPLSEEHAIRIARGLLAEWLASDEKSRLNSGAAHQENVDKWMEARSADMREDLAGGNHRAVAPEVSSALHESGLHYSELDPSFLLLARELLKVRVMYVNAVAERQRGWIVESPAIATQYGDPVRANRNMVTVRQLIAAYRTEREREHGKESTDRKYGHIFRALEEVLGSETPIRGVTRASCRAVRDLLERVPANSSKKYPGLALRDAAEVGQRGGAPRLAPNTVGSYMNNLSAMLNWAVNEEWLERNPAKGLISKDKPTVQRRGMTPDELQVIFRALMGEREALPWRFWVPALALFTGARAAELCQLLVTDVVEVHGTSCLDLSEFDQAGARVSDKSLKTATSKRFVPVHPQLVAAGFLEFVTAAREEGRERLFPDLVRGPKDSYSHELSKWFGRFMDDVGLTQPALVFHSFRHGFRDACRFADIAEDTARALGGWAGNNQAAAYGDRGAVPVLNRAINKISFGDFLLPEKTPADNINDAPGEDGRKPSRAKPAPRAKGLSHES
jgi:integrase